MWYYVTKKLIQTGQKRSASMCPVAKAIQRKHPTLAKNNRIEVGVRKALIWDQYGACEEYELPNIAKRFVMEFDLGVPRKPIRFWLNIYAKSSRIV